MHTDQSVTYPNLALLAGEYWRNEWPDPLSDCVPNYEIELLKLYASIIWPMPDMEDRRLGFLAEAALLLFLKYIDMADRIKLNEDGFHSKDSQRAVVRLYDHIGKQSKLNLFYPSGGINAALQRGLPDIKKDIDNQLRKMRAGVLVGDFLLRYMAHFPNKWIEATVNRAVFFIESSGYGTEAVNVPRHRSEIIKFWAQTKRQSSLVSLHFTRNPPSYQTSRDQRDPAECLEKIWWEDLRREQFFGIANYCEMQLTKLEPL